MNNRNNGETDENYTNPMEDEGLDFINFSMTPMEILFAAAAGLAIASLITTVIVIAIS